MATTVFPDTKLSKSALSDIDWDKPISSNAEILAGMASLSGLCVTSKEVPSTSLNVRVAAGSYRKGSGTKATYAGTTSQAITASTTKVLYLDSSGALQVGTSYPTSGAYTPLATVVAGSSTITSITDNRVSACEILASLASAANDTAAATAGVPIGGLYQDTTGVVRVRLA